MGAYNIIRATMFTFSEDEMVKVEGNVYTPRKYFTNF